VSAQETVEQRIEGRTDANGAFRARFNHRLPPAGFTGVSLNFGGLNVPVFANAVAAESPLLSATRGALVPGALTLQVAQAEFEDDGSDALAGSVVLVPGGRAVRITFELRSVGNPVVNAPVAFTLNGSGALASGSTRTGTLDSGRGQAAVTFVPAPGSTGVAFVAMTGQAPDGRTVTQAASLQIS
jgi:hypothetical protein